MTPRVPSAAARFTAARLICALTLLAGFSTALLHGQMAARLAHPTVRVTAKVDRTVTATLKATHPGAVDRAAIGSRLTAGTKLEHMILVLKPSDEQEASLHTLLDAQQDKGSASFHKWFTPDSFNASFGVASADIAKVSAWMTESGLSVESVARSGRFITFSGNVGSVESAFSTEMHNLTVNGEAHISNTTDLSVPAALAPVVKGVASLNDFRPRNKAVGFKKVTVKANASGGYDGVAPEYGSSATGTHYIGAGDLATIFNATPLTDSGNTGKGITISVLARSNISLADVETYRSFFGLPKNDPNIIVVGTDPGQNGDDIEAFLDAEMAGSLATGATVDFIVSGVSLVGGDIDAAGLYAVDNNVGDVITLSYGGCEADNGADGTAFWNILWEQAAAQGQTAFVSSGDSSAAGCDSSGNSYATGGYGVNALGSSAYNVAVGGSMFVDYGPAQYWGAASTIPYSTALSYIPEAAWNQGRFSTTYLNSAATATQTGSGIVGGGGGISMFTARPSWQTGSGIPTGTDAIHVYSGTGIAAGSPITGLHRLVPDVSFIAANGHDGTLFCAEGVCSESVTGGLANAGVVGGTSVAAPAMASAQALIDAANGGRQGNANIYYYGLANQQYTASATACQAAIGTAANPAVTLPAGTCNFHDIVAGSNIVPTASTGTAGLGFSAGAGFDEASGLGSVNIANVARNWSSVAFNATATSFTLTPTTATHGASQNFTVAVTPASGSGTPTGDISIIASQETAYGTPQVFTLAGGSASGIINSLPAGTYSVHAHYAGDSTFASSDSAPVSVTIGKEGSSTNLYPYLITAAGSVTATNSFTYGAGEIYLDTEITPTSGNGVASGAVTYTITDNGAALAGLTNHLDTNGTTYFLAGPSFTSFYLVANYPTLSPGSYTVQAAYAGDTSFGASTSTTGFTVLKATPAVTFNAATARVGTGTTATLNFAIATPTAATPASGTVTFTDTTSGTVLGTGTLSGGAVVFSTTGITTSGANTVSAVYAGDLNYAAATGSVTVTVSSLATTTTTLTSSTATPSVGTSVTLTAIVNPIPTTAAQVSFYDAGMLLGTGTVSTGTGKATLAVTKFTAGIQSLTAIYAGNPAQATSTGSLALTVAKSTTTMQIGGADNSTFGATVLLDGAFSRFPVTTGAPAVAPTGTISFYDGGSTSGTPLGTAVPTYQTGGYNYYEATLSLNTLAVGSHSIVAYYPGDANYTASTSVAKPLTVGLGVPLITVPPVTITYGTASATLTASAAYSGTVAPTGAVTFSVDSGAAVTAICTGGGSPRTCTATYPTASLAGGSHTITATEAADSNFAAATGTGTLTVNAVSNGSILLSAVPSLSGSASGGYVATIIVKNTGTGVAPAAVLTGVTVGSVNGTPTPQVLGSIQPGASVTVTVSVPSAAGADGARAAGRITGTYTGGSFSGSYRLILP